MSYRDAIRAAMSSPSMEEGERAERHEASAERYRNSSQYAADVKAGRTAELKRLRAACLSPRIAGNATAMHHVIAFAAEMPEASADELVSASLSGRAPKTASATTVGSSGSSTRVDIAANACDRQSDAGGPNDLQSNMRALLASDRGEPNKRSPGLLAMAVERYGPKAAAPVEPGSGSSRLVAMANQRYGPKNEAE